MILTNPYFLLGLLAVAIPIVVHLFNFRRYKKVYFSNVDYLQQLQSETRKQSRLREYLILACRIAAIIFLVLAFTQPVIPNKDTTLKQGANSVSVYLDNSFSMENTNSDGTLLEMGKRKAVEIASAYKPTDQFQLLTNDMKGENFHWVSRDEFLAMVDRVEVSAAAPLLAEMIGKQQDFLHSGNGRNKLAYVVSDFQRSTADFENYPNDSSVSTTFVPLEGDAIDNISIDSVTFSTPVFLKGSPVNATIHVTNHGSNGVDNLPVRLFSNGKERALGSVNLGPRSHTTLDLAFVIDQSGVMHCHVETTDYPITFDDKFFFSLNIHQNISMLEIYGTKDHSPYLEKLFGQDSLVIYHHTAHNRIDFNTLNEHNLIVLNELPTLSSGLAQALQKQIETGSSVLVIPAPDAEAGSYNAFLQSLQAPTLASFSKKEAKAEVINTQSRLYSNVFSGKVDDNLERPTLHSYFHIQRGTNTLAEPIIALANGDAYLTETRFGMGKVYLFSTPLRPEFSDFMQQALFVPTLYNMVLLSQPLGETYTTIDNTNPVVLARNIDLGEGTTKLHNSDRSVELIPDLRNMGGRTYLVPHNQIESAGNYTLVSSQSAEEQGLSFNYSRLESKMDFLDRREVESAIKDYHLVNCNVVKSAEKPLDDFIRSQTEGRSLWRWCIVLTLLMLALEILLIRLPKRKQNNNPHKTSA